MHKPQKKHNEIRGYVKRVFYARAVTPLYHRKKSRGLKNLCFYAVYNVARPQAGIFTVGRYVYHRSHFTVSRDFTIGRIFTVGRHFCIEKITLP